MLAYFENISSLNLNDSKIQSLSWMGKVNVDKTKEKDIKCDRFLYYQEGWLATGNQNGVVSSTFTSCINDDQYEYLIEKHGQKLPQRTNFNLRGHKNEVKLVKWNEPYQKLATCDSKGVIYIWIKYEGRWSIELINDRGKIVSDFAWSHDGRVIVISYEDGFVLVGSVNGQRFWSHLFELSSNCYISSSTWTPNDAYVLLGLSNGNLMVVDEHGSYLSRITITNACLTQLAYNCPKFFMDEEMSSNMSTSINTPKNHINNSDYVLACAFTSNGYIYILNTYDDIDSTLINTQLKHIKFEWSNCGNYLAVGGIDNENKNWIKFYSKKGELLTSLELPNNSTSFTALTWGHNDERLFVSTLNSMHIAHVKKEISSLNLLSRLIIKQKLKDINSLNSINLPFRLKDDLKNMFNTTLKAVYPKYDKIKEFVCKTDPKSERLHCTMKCNESDELYTLYLEYLGSLVPLLKAKKCSKLKPDFVIYDPSEALFTNKNNKNKKNLNENERLLSSGYSSNTDDDDDDETIIMESLCGSPRAKFKQLNKKLVCKQKLVEIISNIWGTKFKFLGLNGLPTSIGSITYKTSLLHLQPRQMTITIKDLSQINRVRKVTKSEDEEIHELYNDDEDLISTTNSSSLIYTSSNNNTISELQGTSRSTSPQNLIRPISPPAMQMAGVPIATSPRITRQQLITSAQRHLSATSSVLSINESNRQQSDTLNTQNLESLLSCLDPTTTNTSNRVSLSSYKRNLSKSMKEKNTKQINNLICRSERLSLSDPFLPKKQLDKKQKAQKHHQIKKKKSFLKRYNSISNGKREKVARNKLEKLYTEYVMHNKPPLWNETNQVYQLDFGGRVTQESAKNFQIDFNGKQVMQFGRIDENAYTLDFEWPFTAVQAFSIALANITQRLK